MTPIRSRVMSTDESSGGDEEGGYEGVSASGDGDC